MRFFRAALPAFLLPLLLLAACEVPPPDLELTPEDREAIEALADAYGELAMAGDWDEWAALFRDDGIYVPRRAPGVEGVEGPEGLRELADAIVSIDHLELRTTEVEGTPQLAHSRGTYRVDGIMRENDEEVALADEGKWLAVVRRDQDGEWRFYRLIANSDVARLPE